MSGALRSWMELLVDLGEALLVHVRVDLGGGDVGVAEEFLDHTEVGPILEQVGGKGVPEKVWVNLEVEAGARCPLLDDLPDAVGAQGTAADREKDLRAGSHLGVDQTGAFIGEVVLERGAGTTPDRDDAGLVALQSPGRSTGFASLFG